MSSVAWQVPPPVMETEAQEGRRRAKETEEAAKSEHQDQEMLAQAAEKNAKEKALESRRRVLEPKAAAQSMTEALDVAQKKLGAASSQREAASARSGGKKDQRDLDARMASLEAFAKVQRREYESSRRVLAEQKRQMKQRREAQQRAAADAVHHEEMKEQARATREAHEKARKEEQFKREEVDRLRAKSRAEERLRRRKREMKKQVRLAQENQKRNQGTEEQSGDGVVWGWVGW